MYIDVQPSVYKIKLPIFVCSPRNRFGPTRRESQLPGRPREVDELPPIPGCKMRILVQLLIQPFFFFSFFFGGGSLDFCCCFCLVGFFFPS